MAINTIAWQVHLHAQRLPNVLDDTAKPHQAPAIRLGSRPLAGLGMSGPRNTLVGVRQSTARTGPEAIEDGRGQPDPGWPEFFQMSP